MSNMFARITTAIKTFRGYPSAPPMLGRWCHPTSNVYAHSCNQNVKADLANADNSAGLSLNTQAVTKNEIKKDPVSVFIYE